MSTRQFIIIIISSSSDISIASQSKVRSMSTSSTVKMMTAAKHCTLLIEIDEVRRLEGLKEMKSDVSINIKVATRWVRLRSIL